MRDCVKQADIGDKLVRRNPGFDICPGEYHQLQEIYNDRGGREAFSTAFLFGYAVGAMAERKEPSATSSERRS